MVTTKLSSDECYKLVGQIVITSSHLEAAVFKLLSLLLSADFELTVRVAAGMRFSDLVALTKSFIHYRLQGAESKKATTILSLASNAYDLRSHYVHADIRVPKKPDGPSWVKLYKVSRDKSRGIKAKWVTVTKSDLRKVVTRLETMLRRVEQMTKRLDPKIKRHRRYTAKKPTIGWDQDGHLVFENPKHGFVWRTGSRFPEKKIRLRRGFQSG